MKLAPSSVTAETLKALQENLRLKPSQAGGCFGPVGGIPIHFLPANTKGNARSIGLLAWIPRPEEASDFLKQLESDPDLKAAGYDKKCAIQQADTLLYVFPTGFFGGLKIDKITIFLGPFLKNWKMQFSRSLEGAPERKVALVGEVPRLATPEEIAGIQAEGAQMDAAYGQIKPRRGLALAGTLGVSILGAVLWGAIGAFADLQAWIVAIGIGYGIAWVAAKLSRRVDTLVRASAFLGTLLSVILGQILMIAFLVMKERGDIAWPVAIMGAALSYFQLLGDGEILKDFLFAVGGGLVGAWYAAKQLTPPIFTPRIELFE